MANRNLNVNLYLLLLMFIAGTSTQAQSLGVYGGVALPQGSFGLTTARPYSFGYAEPGGYIAMSYTQFFMWFVAEGGVSYTVNPTNAKLYEDEVISLFTSNE